MRHVIIGNSAAGIRAAETLRSIDSEAEIYIVAEEEVPAYSRCQLPDYLAGDRSKGELRIRPNDFYTKNNIKTLFGQRVKSVDADNKSIKLENKKNLSYDKLLIATGASSFIPPIPGIDTDGVFALRDLEDADRIISKSNETRRAVIIGAGFVGLEAAYALYERGLEVTVVDVMSHILPRQFDKKAGEILKRDMQGEGIRFILGQGVKEIATPGLLKRIFLKKGKGVILDNGEYLKSELMVVATGTRANVELVENTEMEINKGIPVDEYMETSIQDIYAAGDVAETKDVVTGEKGLTPIWPNASAQGRVAAHNMAGKMKTYDGLIGMQNSVEFRKVPAIAMGITQVEEDSEYEVLSEYRPEKNLYKKLVIKGDILHGMILIGDIHQAGIYGALIKKKADIGPYKKILLQADFNYGHILNRTAT